MGEQILWGEAVALTRTAIHDTRTYLGAAAAGLKFPTSRTEMLQTTQIIAMTGDRSLGDYFLPFRDEEREVDPDELAAAEKALEESIVFA